MSVDEEIVYDFPTELHKTKRVSDFIFARAENQFGKQGVIDMTAINAYYMPLVMQMNMAEYEAQKEAKRPKRFPANQLAE
jgi:4-carboxymuconolactone decarboxylase